MSKHHVERTIRARKGNKDSVNDQIAVAHAMWDRGIVPGINGPTRKQLQGRLGLRLRYRPKTVLDHLVEAGMITEYQEDGPKTRVIATWRSDGVVNGAVLDAAKDGIQSLIQHMRATDPPHDRSAASTDGGIGPIRAVLAKQFEVAAGGVEDELSTGDRVEKLNQAVEAITEAGFRTRDDYGKIIFRNKPYHYRLSADAIRLYRS
jgi:hypothetical protein